MSNLREAAKQALEALYRAREFTELYDTEHAASVNEQCHDTIAALRTALKEPMQEEQYAHRAWYTIDEVNKKWGGA